MRGASWLAITAAPVLVTSVAFGPAVAAPAAPAAPAAKCSMSRDDLNSEPGKTVYLLRGKGFTPGATFELRGEWVTSGNGGMGAGGTVPANGTITLSELPAGTFFVSSSKDGDVFCGATPKEKAGKSRQYRKGYDRGYADIRHNCRAKPPRDINRQSMDWREGYQDGAAKATEKFCH
ncbi:hypothetical protein ABZ128_27300 [Streptomyces sp. NPDC006326]|uniref:hypothetical protein n=1 Tax=Streptomyces sp. NPDC006326 TaxID=3156752 RepID=UPI0033A61CD2